MSHKKYKTDEIIPPDYTMEYSCTISLVDRPPRHIFIFLDGTWNEERTKLGESTPTNVLRMFKDIKIGKDEVNEIEIFKYYYRGVGNRQDNKLVSRLWFGFNGKDEERIRSAAFSDIVRNCTGVFDKVYMVPSKKVWVT